MIRDGLNIIDNNYNNAAALGELLQYGPNGIQLWNPAIDLMDSVNSILLVIYIPGVNKESLNISFMANYIIVSGRRDFPDYPPLHDNVLNNNHHDIHLAILILPRRRMRILRRHILPGSKRARGRARRNNNRNSALAHL